MMSLTLPSKSMNVSLLLKTTEQSHTKRFVSEDKVHEDSCMEQAVNQYLAFD